jgi:hypothetical protein
MSDEELEEDEPEAPTGYIVCGVCGGGGVTRRARGAIGPIRPGVGVFVLDDDTALSGLPPGVLATAYTSEPCKYCSGRGWFAS